MAEFATLAAMDYEVAEAGGAAGRSLLRDRACYSEESVVGGLEKRGRGAGRKKTSGRRRSPRLFPERGEEFLQRMP